MAGRTPCCSVFYCLGVVSDSVSSESANPETKVGTKAAACVRSTLDKQGGTTLSCAGTLQPMKEIGELCRSKKVFFHTDAAQAVGKMPVDVDEMKIDLMSISAHKLYGPKGIGTSRAFVP
jgi:Cys-tRNA synthase (O-phospho-L-seryl-tRNA:Cys-tRNA synthase)